MSTVVFGIPNCDTVKKARVFLDKNGIDYTFHDFRADPVSETQLQQWVDEIGLENLVNKRSTTYRQLSDNDKTNSQPAHWIALIKAQPTLMKRPVLQHNGTITTGFKESTYQELFHV